MVFGHRKKEILPFPTPWTGPEGVARDKYCVVSHVQSGGRGGGPPNPQEKRSDVCLSEAGEGYGSWVEVVTRYSEQL